MGKSIESINQYQPVVSLMECTSSRRGLTPETETAGCHFTKATPFICWVA